MIKLDGSLGEGGGQILRSALTLSLCTGLPFKIAGIRAGRRKPGLLRQHLTAVQAAKQIGGAQVVGDTLGSKELEFVPGALASGEFHFKIGSAGSTMLVLQTVLPALATTGSPSSVLVEGGTHNPMAPPFPYLQRVLRPLLRRCGMAVDFKLRKPGFYPAGGGLVEAQVSAVVAEPLSLQERGDTVSVRALVELADLGFHIAEREFEVVRRAKLVPKGELVCEHNVLAGAASPGNLVAIEVTSQHVTEMFCGFGAPRVRAEDVAQSAVQEARAYFAADVPVGPHLADQLLLPMALGAGGEFATCQPTPHTVTNAHVIEQFLPVKIEAAPAKDAHPSPNAWMVRVLEK